MKIMQFQLLTAIEDLGSLAKAAEKLYISQPTGSIAIKELEEELGCQIFYRANRSLHFTEKGNAILEQARLILNEIEEIENISKNHHKEIKLGLDKETRKNFFACLVENIKAHPDLQISQTIYGREELIYNIIDKNIDIGIISLASRRYEPELWQIIEGSGLAFCVARKEMICFLAADTHPLQARKNIGLVDVLQYPYVTSTDSRNQYFLDLFSKFGREKKITYIDNLDALYKFIQNTEMITVCPVDEVEWINEKYNRCLKKLLLSQFSFSYQVGVLYRSMHLNDNEKELINILVSVFRDG